MRNYVVHGNTISPSIGSVTATGKDIVLKSIRDLDGRRFPLRRIVDFCNALPNAGPVRGFKTREAGLKHLWAAMEKLPIALSRPKSKQARLVGLLRRPRGATLTELMSATGWQAHSVRGAISGAIRKKLGLNVITQADGDRRFYQLA
jgi:hypothetical protein